MSRGKRAFVCLCSLLFFFLSGPGDPRAGGPEKSIGEHFGGEVLRYDFGFWIFTRAGEGVVTFKRLGDGKCQADYEGKTLGIVGLITRYRCDRYRSTMAMDEGGRRLIPLRYEEDVVIGKKTRKRICVFDYAARKIMIEIDRNGKHSREEIPIPAGTHYADPVTAFFNFRFGVYGRVEPGKVYLIPTLPDKKGTKTLRLTVAARDDGARKRSPEGRGEGRDLFVSAQLDREMVGSIHGVVEGWFNADLVPVSGVAKDVFLFGDLRGTLTHQGLGKGPGK